MRITIPYETPTGGIWSTCPEVIRIVHRFWSGDGFILRHGDVHDLSVMMNVHRAYTHIIMSYIALLLSGERARANGELVPNMDVTG